MRYRYVILLAAVLMQACLGATYSWSTFVGLIRPATSIPQATAQLPFTVFYIVFPATMIFSGRLLRTLGPRGCSVLGGLVFGGGWMVANLGKYHFAWTIAGVGVLGGLGVGLAYIVPIAIGMLWFPRNKGLVTGISVAGFASGAALVSQVGEHFVAAGMGPFDVFRYLGAGFVLFVVGAGFLMRYPADYAAKSVRPVSLSQTLRDPAFRMLYLAMFAGLAAGLTVIPNLKQLCPVAVAAAIPVLAIANAAGRVCWGMLFDRVLQTRAIRLNLLSQAALLAVAPWLVRTPLGLLAVATMAGFNYGGVLVLYASAAAHGWGTEQVGQVYGRLFSANIPASIAPLLAGIVYDRTGTFTGPLMSLSALLLLVALVTPAPQPRVAEAA
jgi:OFA family oxalate/formate antiporter-like MFS transporter